MSVVKVIEVLAQSDESWEDAAKAALEEASRTVRNIRSLYVQELQIVLKDGQPQYRIDAKISFEVDPDHHGETRLEELRERVAVAKDGR